MANYTWKHIPGSKVFKRKSSVNVKNSITVKRVRYTPDVYSSRYKRRLVQQETEKFVQHFRHTIDEIMNEKATVVDSSSNVLSDQKLDESENPLLLINELSSVEVCNGKESIGVKVETQQCNNNIPIDCSSIVEKCMVDSQGKLNNHEEHKKYEDTDEQDHGTMNDELVLELDDMEEEYRYSDIEDEGFVDDNEDVDNNVYGEEESKKIQDTDHRSGKENMTIALLKRFREKESESAVISKQLLNLLPRWQLGSNIEITSMTKLLHAIRDEVPFLKLPLDGRKLVKTPRQVVTHRVGYGEYHHFGLRSCLEKMIAELKKRGIEKKQIDLLINMDGAPVGKSSAKNLWPILCSDDVIKKVYIIGVYYGDSKPDDANEFMKYFVDDAIEHVNNGLELDSIQYQVRIHGIIFDAPAKAYILGVKYHSGYYSCTKCEIKGIWKDGVCFPGSGNVPRTDAKFNRYAYMKSNKSVKENADDKAGYQVKETILTKIPKLGLVSQVPVDPMHLGFLGCERKQIYIWKFSSTRYRLRSSQIDQMSESLVSLKAHVPYEFARKPRDLKEIKNFKATEFRQLTFYTGVVAFARHSNSKVYDNYVTFHVVMSIFSNPILCKDKEWVDYGEKLSIKFVKQFKKLYGKKYVSHNIHNFQHLADDVRRYGELDNFSAFRFENAIAQMKKFIRSGHQPLQQLARRAKEIEILQNVPDSPNKQDSLRQPHNEGPVTNRFDSVSQYKMAYFEGFKINCRDDKNNYVLIGKCRYVRIVNIVVNDEDGEIYAIGQQLKVLEPLYTYPCSSYKLGIAVVHSSLDAELQVFNVKEIAAKLSKCQTRKIS